MMGTERHYQTGSNRQRITVRQFAEAVRDTVAAYTGLCKLTDRKGGKELRDSLEALRKYAYGVIQTVKDGSTDHRKMLAAYGFAHKVTQELRLQFDKALESGAAEVLEILATTRKEAPKLIAPEETKIVELQEAYRAAISAEPGDHDEIIAAYKAMRQHAIELQRRIGSHKEAEAAAKREAKRREQEIAITSELEAELARLDF